MVVGAGLMALKRLTIIGLVITMRIRVIMTMRIRMILTMRILMMIQKARLKMSLLFIRKNGIPLKNMTLGMVSVRKKIRYVNHVSN